MTGALGSWAVAPLGTPATPRLRPNTMTMKRFIWEPSQAGYDGCSEPRVTALIPQDLCRFQPIQRLDHQPGFRIARCSDHAPQLGKIYAAVLRIRPWCPSSRCETSVTVSPRIPIYRTSRSGV